MALPSLGPGPIDVVGVGENSVDIVAGIPRPPTPDEKVELLDLSTLPGGQVASALVACARLGCSTAYLGVFGDDENGRVVEGALRAEGVDTSACFHAAAPNRSAIVIAERESGTRTVLWRRPAEMSWPSSQATPEFLSQARILLVDATDIDASVAAAQEARSAGVPVLADVDGERPDLKRLLSHVDVLVTSGAFPQAHTGEPSLSKAMRALKATYEPSVVVVTRGAGGAIAWDGSHEVKSPGFVVPVVDSTGAGDAFRGGFAARWIAAAAVGPVVLAELLTFANAVAALNCLAVGAQTGLPTKAAVEALLTDPGAPRSNRSSPAVKTRRVSR